MKHILMVVNTFIAAIAVQGEPELKGTPSQLFGYLDSIPKVVIISGESEIRVEADKAYVQLKVSTESKELSDALTKNAVLRHKIKEELKAEGIAEQHITGSRFASQPEYGLFSDKAKSYKVNNSIRVSIDDEKEFRIVASAIDKYDEVSYSGVAFESSNESELRQNALEAACKDATQKRALYEKSLGVALSTQSFSDGVVQIEVPGDMQRPGYDVSSVSGMKRSRAVAAGSPDVSQFAEITYRAQMSVRYEVQSE